VPLSWRLAEALADFRRARFNPSRDTQVFETGYSELRQALLRRAYTRAARWRVYV